MSFDIASVQRTKISAVCKLLLDEQVRLNKEAVRIREVRPLEFEALNNLANELAVLANDLQTSLAVVIMKRGYGDGR